MSEEETTPTTADQYLQRIHRDIRVLRDLASKVVNASVEAEAEIPEKIRRFVMYMHDIHDIINMYEEKGHQAPPHLKQEAERCDDRFRQLLEQLHSEEGAFSKVRREMADDPANRWDHTRLLSKEST